MQLIRRLNNLEVYYQSRFGDIVVYRRVFQFNFNYLFRKKKWLYPYKSESINEVLEDFVCYVLPYRNDISIDQFYEYFNHYVGVCDQLKYVHNLASNRLLMCKDARNNWMRAMKYFAQFIEKNEDAETRRQFNRLLREAETQII